MTVAVLVNSQAIAPSDPEKKLVILNDIRELVEATAGFQIDRGDVVTIKALDFKPRTTPEKHLIPKVCFPQTIDITAPLKS